MIFVCFYGCVVCPLKPGLYKLNRGSGRRHKNQSFSSHRPSNGKKVMFFVIPEMPSKTFVMVEKKLPDHFKSILENEHLKECTDNMNFST